MKPILTLAAAAILMLSACQTGPEGKADKALKEAIKMSDDQYAQKVLKLKESYQYYKQAILPYIQNRQEIPVKLKNKYLASTMTRIEVLAENTTYDMDVFTLLREDVENYITEAEITPEIKDRFATFLINLAQFKTDQGNITGAMADLKQAVKVAANKAVPETKLADSKKSFATSQLDMAKELFDTGVKEDSKGDVISAEYYTKVALKYDEENAEAVELLSKTRKELTDTYTAYVSVITDYTDTTLFESINTFDILMASTKMRKRGRSLTMDIVMINDAYNALRLKAKDFAIEYEDGTIVKAKKASFKKSLLDQKRETKGTLTFSAKKGKVKKLTYVNSHDKDLNSEKFFF